MENPYNWRFSSEAGWFELMRKLFFCYMLMPITGLFLLKHENQEVRFHAWQSIYLGIYFIIGLVLFGLIEVAISLINESMGRIVYYAIPVWGAIFCMFWFYVMFGIRSGKERWLPFISKSALSHVNES